MNYLIIFIGKAALHEPALAVLSYTPEKATETVAWVGKGIVYDTGGLSIKGDISFSNAKFFVIFLLIPLNFIRNYVDFFVNGNVMLCEWN